MVIIKGNNLIWGNQSQDIASFPIIAFPTFQDVVQSFLGGRHLGIAEQRPGI